MKDPRSDAGRTKKNSLKWLSRISVVEATDFIGVESEQIHFCILLRYVLMIAFCILCFVGILACFIQCQPATSWNAVAIDNSGINMYAVGAINSIFASHDGGSSWVTAYDSENSWVDVATDGTGKYVAVATNNGGIFLSSDFGNTWQLSSAPFQNWRVINSDKSGAHLTAGLQEGGIYASVDYGKSWYLSNSTDDLWTNIVSDSSGKYLLALAPSFFDSIYKSNNYGFNWTLIPSVEMLIWRAIACDHTGQRVIGAPQNGFLYISEDRGSTWNVTLHSFQIWKSVASSADGQVLAASFVNTGYPRDLSIYISLNGGDSWHLSRVVPAGSGSDLAMSIAGDIILLGTTGDGPLFTTNNYGEDWMAHISQCYAGSGYNPVVGICELCCLNQLACGSANDGTSAYCTPCPKYSLSEHPYDSCYDPCKYPFVPTLSKSDNQGYECTYISLRALSLSLLVPFLFILAAIHIGNIYYLSTTQKAMMDDPEYVFIVAVLTALPCLEFATSLLVVLTLTFHSLATFILFVGSVLYPTVLIVMDVLHQRRAKQWRPYLWMPSSIWKIFHRIDSLPKLFIVSLLSSPFFVVNLVWMLPMLMVLFALYATKLYAFANIANVWHGLWSGYSSCPDICPEDTNSLITTSLIREESAPKLSISSAVTGAKVVDIAIYVRNFVHSLIFQTLPMSVIVLYTVDSGDEITEPVVLSYLMCAVLIALRLVIVLLHIWCNEATTATYRRSAQHVLLLQYLTDNFVGERNSCDHRFSWHFLFPLTAESKAEEDEDEDENEMENCVMVTEMIDQEVLAMERRLRHRLHCIKEQHNAAGFSGLADV